jgi:hypothetical protein
VLHGPLPRVAGAGGWWFCSTSTILLEGSSTTFRSDATLRNPRKREFSEQRCARFLPAWLLGHEPSAPSKVGFELTTLRLQDLVLVVRRFPASSGVCVMLAEVEPWLEIGSREQTLSCALRVASSGLARSVRRQSALVRGACPLAASPEDGSRCIRQ